MFASHEWLAQSSSVEQGAHVLVPVHRWLVHSESLLHALPADLPQRFVRLSQLPPAQLPSLEQTPPPGAAHRPMEHLLLAQLESFEQAAHTLATHHRLAQSACSVHGEWSGSRHIPLHAPVEQSASDKHVAPAFPRVVVVHTPFPSHTSVPSSQSAR